MITTASPASPDIDPTHPVQTPDQRLAQRRALLARERELTRLSDQVARERRALPWVRIDEPYRFDTPGGGHCTLADLFDGRRQLLVQHFMLGPDQAEGCPSCSFMADHWAGALPHLAQRDVAVAVVSRAPIARIESFRQRMGWTFRWVSSHGNRFNRDFHVSFTPEELAAGDVFYNHQRRPFPQEEAPGISAFIRADDGSIFHTYSTYGRGVEVLMGTYPLLDLVARGRDEDALPFTMAWVRHHDRYETRPRTETAGTGCCHAGTGCTAA